MQETQEILGPEHFLEKGMATHSNILAWKITLTEEPGGLQSRGRKDADTAEQLSTDTLGKDQWLDEMSAEGR